MKRLLVSLLISLAHQGVASAKGGLTPAQFDQQVSAELTAINPEAARLIVEATAARDGGSLAKADELYKKVETLAPKSPHAFRRHAATLMALRRPDEAVTLARQAFALDKSAYDRAALAAALANRGTPADVAEGIGLAAVASLDAPDDLSTQQTLCVVAIRANRLSELDNCVERLDAIKAADQASEYFRSIRHAAHEDFDGAEAALERAHAAGLPDADYQRMHTELANAKPSYLRVWPWVVRIGGAWLGGFALLFVLGALLSGAALRAARRVPSLRDGSLTGTDHVLRKLYAAVLTLCCVYYYVSIPLTLIVVVVAGGGIVYACFAVGQVPIKLVAIVVIVVIATVASVLKSLFVRSRDVDPGQKLDLAANPRLRALLDEVARKVGTRAVDNVYLTPGTDVAVTERGGMWRTVRGTTERCLILGVAVLRDFPVGELKAVLAHEYGHFTNRDTAGGSFALAVRRSLLVMAHSLAQSGAAAWYNPAWLFLNGFFRLFLRISQGASRLQEVLADRWAAAAYGSESFERGLRHVVGAEAHFRAHVNATIKEVVDGHLPLPNLYRYQPAAAVSESDVASTVDEALNRKPSPYDSHPAPADRIAWVRALGAVGVHAISDGDPAWSLFADPDGLEQQMTAEVRDNVANQLGVEIPAVAEAA